MTKQVVVLIGAGSIGQAIARRVGIGKHILLADLKQNNLDSAQHILEAAGFETSTQVVDISSKTSIQFLVKKACEIGTITNLIHAAGVSPSQVTKEVVLKVDLYGTAVILEEFGKVIASGGSGLIISSQSGHRLPSLTHQENQALALEPVEELLSLPIIRTVKDSLGAYQIAKRANVLRVASEAVKWGAKGARINSISPGIIMTPLALDELSGPRGDGYRAMISKTVEHRPATPDEIGDLGAFMMGPSGHFINGSDFLIDGGVTANYWYGDVQEVRAYQKED